MDIFHKATRSDKSKNRKVLEKMDIFDNVAKTSKMAGRRKSKTSRSEMVIRMVLPAEQMTAIAKSMLERQAKPKDVSIIGQNEIQPTSAKRKRQKSKVGETDRKSKKPRQDPPSTGIKSKENTGELDNIVTIGQVLK